LTELHEKSRVETRPTGVDLTQRVRVRDNMMKSSFLAPTNGPR